MILKINNYFRKFINIIGNLKLAILLLLIIAISSALGTVIEQNQSISFYESSYPNSSPLFGFLSANLIFVLGLNNIYQTWWFILLVIILAISLFSCTLARQIPALKMARLWQFYAKEQSFKKLAINFNLTKTSLSKLAFILRSYNYNVIQKGNLLYAYKGLLGKVGPIIVHISLIIILFGSLLGNLSGFVAQELIPLGGIFHIQNIINSGKISYIPQNVIGYVKDFKIAYNDEGAIDQFYSDLSILNSNNEEVANKTIYVNEPLRYNGIVFYQTDWSITNLIINIDGRSDFQLQIKPIEVKNQGKFWITSLPLLSKEEKISDKILLVLEDLTGKILVYDSKQTLLAMINVGENLALHGHLIKIKDIISSTGLQIKSDPGITFVYIGFFFLMLSIILSYFSYYQIWAVKKDKNLYISGITNRAIYHFEQQIINMVSKLNKFSN